MKATLAVGIIILASIGSAIGAQVLPISKQQESRSVRDGVESLDWRVQAEDSQNLARLGIRDLQLFVQKQLAAEDKVSGSGEKINASYGDICSVAVVDLSGGKTYSILASIDWTGRHFCNDLRIFTQDSTGIRHQDFQAWDVEDVAKLVVDIRGDGIKELAIPKSYSSYDGAKCVAIWTSIHATSNGNMADVCTEFNSYYKNRLQILQDRLSKGEDQPECAQMELDKIERFLKVSPSAGFERAQRWIQSNNPSLRSKAIVVFGDILDDPSKRELVKVVANGSDEDAAAAKIYLAAKPAR